MDPNTWKTLVFNKDDILIRQGKKGTAGTIGQTSGKKTEL